MVAMLAAEMSVAVVIVVETPAVVATGAAEMLVVVTSAVAVETGNPAQVCTIEPRGAMHLSVFSLMDFAWTSPHRFA
jgi:ABC-type phosphonate transport system ATPase subunit